MIINTLFRIIISIFLFISHYYCNDVSNKERIYFNTADESAQSTPEIVTENTVVFIILSQIDYEKLIKQNPKQEMGITENISDFKSYSKRISEKLDKRGIINRYSISKEIQFKYADGKKEELLFESSNIFGLALFAKGKKPKIAYEFDANYYSIAKIINEYFGIELIK